MWISTIRIALGFPPLGPIRNALSGEREPLRRPLVPARLDRSVVSGATPHGTRHPEDQCTQCRA